MESGSSWHSPAASTCLLYLPDLCPLLSHWHREEFGTRFISSSFAKGPLLHAGYAAKWFFWRAVVLEFCRFGWCFWEASAPLLALCNQGVCHPGELCHCHDIGGESGQICVYIDDPAVCGSCWKNGKHFCPFYRLGLFSPPKYLPFNQNALK